MKRTIVEVLCGLAVAVLLISFHQQITRLKAASGEVHELRDIVANSVAQSGEEADISTLHAQLVGDFDSRIQALAEELAIAEARFEEAASLRQELEAARREADLLKAELSRDFSRTRELVDAFHRQLDAQDRFARDELQATRAEIETLNERLAPDKKTLQRELLSPTVQLNGEDTVGSGTLIYSRLDRAGNGESYVLTSYHVIRNIVADSPRAKHDGLAITIYEEGGSREVRGDMVCHDEKIDAALVKLRGSDLFNNVARIAPLATAGSIEVWDPIYAIGCPLGNDPIPTTGQISSKENRLNGTNYWMINAPTYYGNSGGGIYLADSRQLIGVFSKIYTHGRSNPIVVPHMGLCTPISAVYAWLEREGKAGLLGPAVAAERTLAAPAK